jgi:parvulin-like peptidyl-prolyl isomerase
MRRMTRIAAAAALLCMAALAPAVAQQEPLTEDVAARVGEEPIATSEVEGLVRGQSRGGRGTAPLDPPRFERCVAAERRMSRGRRNRPTRRELRRECQERYERLRADVVTFLVEAVWVRQEAAARGIAVTPEQVRRSLERQKRRAFLNERDYRRFLRDTGHTEADILERVELEMLQSRLTRQVISSLPPVTSQDVDRYYETHRRRFRDEPPRRARRIIRGLLTAQRRQRAVSRFVADFRARYREITVCADGYVVDVCGNSS